MIMRIYDLGSCRYLEGVRDMRTAEYIPRINKRYGIVNEAKLVDTCSSKCYCG